MAAFAFETITATQAAAYSGAVDGLEFQTPGMWAALASVSYVAGVNGAPDMVAVSFNGQTVMFGAGIYGDEDIRFGDGSKLFVGGAGAETTSGTAFSDALFGGQGTDNLQGGLGGDFLQGNQGADTLSGAEGDDRLYGGQGDDTIDVGDAANFGQGNLGNDTVVAAAGAGPNTLLGGQGDDFVRGGDVNDFVNGNLGADSLAGGGGTDSLTGEGGADTLSGDGGADTLDGGEGADLFLALAGSSSVTAQDADRIVNWSFEDLIDVPGFGGPGAYYMIPASYSGGGGYGGEDGGFAPLSFTLALSRANSWMRDHSGDTIVTAQVEEGVAVFVDSNGDRAADLAIILVARGLFDVSGSNFI
jgi:Ca2+-binding RTX toxin-like protein